MITVNILRFNYHDFTPLALFALLTGIGFIVAGYGLWELKYWGALLAGIISCLKIIQILLYTTLSVYTPAGIIFYGGIIMLVLQERRKLK
ncbi:MAG: hypothetical protein JW878_02685 [Methanomicrobia archaeon]|nr:hypothetical protein [Methanomicrobia archaeon]